ncbi:MAG: sugar nucleotide-binding protein [Myxococcota bacterium]|nr:sugar nucleotide-binding protein [Myxococcota bacterium]
MASGAIELWAGVECTVNRVHDRWFDQVERTGHAKRIDDLDRIAALGVRAVRYPVLWERTAPVDLASADWSWADDRMHRLRDLGIRPIVGLLHHGSGPAHTSLVDEELPRKLASFARAVASRYPWVEDFTPINEPLTTARFSGLYGHWYPHGTNAATFVRALVQQCHAIRLAMRAIREVTPAARLVQTEDMGTVFSTPHLAYQAAFENERRWLSLDLLCGRVTVEHPMWRYLVSGGVAPSRLFAFIQEPCIPDIVGINYYVTSDRFLDERLDRYPLHTHGGNRREAYADVEAVRVRGQRIVGHLARLEEAWRRYRQPLAVTEVHLACAREEQLRWLRDAWSGAGQAQGRGVDVRAVTLWSALGATDWNSLLVRDDGQYEPGAFDVRATEPRPTAIVSLARELVATGEGSHPVLAGEGWWRSERRFIYPDVGKRQAALAVPGAKQVLIAGADGTLGRALVRACEERGLAHVALTRHRMDIANSEAIAREFEQLEPWAVINAAGYERVDEAQRDPVRCRRENTTGPQTLAAACRARGIALATFSSDLVFDGTLRRPYVETDAPAPLGIYGRSKADAERIVLDLHPAALVIRTGALYGCDEKRSFVQRAIAAFERRLSFQAPCDLVVSPTYLSDLVHVTIDLLVDGERGIWHLANRGAVTYADLAARAADACGITPGSLVACTAAELGYAAPRPEYSALASRRAKLMPSLDDALVRFAEDRHVRTVGDVPTPIIQPTERAASHRDLIRRLRSGT